MTMILRTLLFTTTGTSTVTGATVVVVAILLLAQRAWYHILTYRTNLKRPTFLCVSHSGPHSQHIERKYIAINGRKEERQTIIYGDRAIC